MSIEVLMQHEKNGSWRLILYTALEIPQPSQAYIDRYTKPRKSDENCAVQPEAPWWLAYRDKLLIQALTDNGSGQTTITGLKGDGRRTNRGQTLAFDTLVGARLAELRKHAARMALKNGAISGWAADVNAVVIPPIIAAIQAKISGYVAEVGNKSLAFYMKSNDRYHIARHTA